jgi:hypothetical protein
MCSRQVIQNSKSVAEAIYWNGTKDLVSIRVTSPISTSEAEKNLLKIKIKAKSEFATQKKVAGL